MKFHRDCWLAHYGTFENRPMPPCEGALVKAHLISQQELKRCIRYEGRDLDLWDPAVWVWACGGPLAGVGYGIGGHHGAFDQAGTLRVPRTSIPEATEVFADDHGLQWYLDAFYGAL